jgi:hypothetical protein
MSKLLAPADLPSEKETQVSTEAGWGLQPVSRQSSGVLLFIIIISIIICGVGLSP